jgi:hypothetical protein
VVSQHPQEDLGTRDNSDGRVRSDEEATVEAKRLKERRVEEMNAKVEHMQGEMRDGVAGGEKKGLFGMSRFVAPRASCLFVPHS